MKATDYEIVNHGYDHCQYFQGCGTYGTPFDEVFTGCADNAKEAYEDAVEQAYSGGRLDHKSLDKLLPTRPKGIRRTDRVPPSLSRHEDSDVYWYVSIRIKTEE